MKVVSRRQGQRKVRNEDIAMTNKKRTISKKFERENRNKSYC